MDLNITRRSSRKSYCKFIGKVVDHVVVKGADGEADLFGSFKYLTKQVPESDVVAKRALAFPVNLRCRDHQGTMHKITLWFTSDNLYLIGYDDGVNLYQFKGVYILNNSTQLNFDGTYGDLARVSGRTVDDVMVGKNALMNDVIILSGRNKSKATDAEKASALLSLVVHICEACRFFSIEDQVSESYLAEEGVVLKLELAALVNKWEKLSKAVKRNSSDPSTLEKLNLAKEHLRIMLNVDV